MRLPLVLWSLLQLNNPSPSSHSIHLPSFPPSLWWSWYILWILSSSCRSWAGIPKLKAAKQGGLSRAGMQWRCKSQKGSYSYITHSTPHCISPHTPWDSRWEGISHFILAVPLLYLPYCTFTHLSRGEMAFHSFAMNTKESFPFWQCRDLWVNQNLLKYSDISKVTLFFQSFRVFPHRACRNKAYWALLWRKEIC